MKRQCRGSLPRKVTENPTEEGMVLWREERSCCPLLRELGETIPEDWPALWTGKRAWQPQRTSQTLNHLPPLRPPDMVLSTVHFGGRQLGRTMGWCGDSAGGRVASWHPV